MTMGYRSKDTRPAAARRGKTWRNLGELWAGDLVEFNAALVGDQLKRPPQITRGMGNPFCLPGNLP